MKKIFSTSVTGMLIWLFSLTYQSCNFLNIDPYITDMPTLDSVFQKRVTTLQYLYNVYSYMPNNGTSWNNDGCPWILVSDEAFGTMRDDDATFNYFANNIMDAGSEYYNKWGKYYQGIRNAGIFLQRVYECKELNSIELKESVGEAQFLRALYYFELMKQYGPVTLVPETGISLETPIDEILMPRNTWDECVAYVSSELKKAAINLPPSRPSSNFGKPTSGAAYAVLSRLLLYSASPMFNGNNSYSDFVSKKTGKPYFNPEYQDVKWAEAAAAARKVIKSNEYALFTAVADENTPHLPQGVNSDPNFYKDYPEGAGGIDNYKSYANVFNGIIMASENKEVIFGMPSMSITKYMGPFKMKGWSTWNVTQKLADAYYMADGSTVEAPSASFPHNGPSSTKDSLFSGYLLKAGVHGWYLNREMRFYATIGFSGSYYYGTSSTTASSTKFQSHFYAGGNCDKNSQNFLGGSGVGSVYCMTGYLCRKYIYQEDNFNNGLVKPKVWIEYRLGEIYLNYAEALNELNGSYTVDGETISKSADEIMKYFNLIRYRAGLPGITLAQAGDQELVRKLIRKERQIELAWEGHRYFDVRRWNAAVTEENGPVRGLNVAKKENEGFYNIVDIKEVGYAYKAYTFRKNFWPIPLKEAIKNPNMDQNPGW